jgi:sec-independent protein translocase protein TatA
MNFSGWEILVVLFVVLLLFGSSRLPQLARGMGKSINEFKKGISDGSTESDERELAEKRRERLRDSERLHEDELTSADKYANKS